MLGVSPAGEEPFVAIEHKDLGATTLGGRLLGELLGLGFRAPPGEEHER